MGGCPSCGADRLKSAPLPVIGWIAQLALGLHRYHCTACRWTGWRRRLRRARRPGATTRIVEDTTSRAAWFFLATVLALAAFAALAAGSCRSIAREPADHSSEERGSEPGEPGGRSHRSVRTAVA